ncbi:hypothetical protein ASPCAL06001 [Aspergillus calidoustus]|uniref:Uncharacterized protein n=1 Tax=Aspergillus calidoustus TaxID=454130 RepID=A0A0U5G1Q6_ASPCI|nr:hypothetical protein ASPCAL06001 [Aspergillus calidoustus]
MSTHENQLLGCDHPMQEPSLECTLEAPVDMTSVRDDFWAFFGQTEEEWNALDQNQSTWTGPSTFPPYAEWIAQDEGNTGLSMVPTDDVQMTDDDAVGVPKPTPCVPSAVAGGVDAGYMNPSVTLSPQHTISGGALPGDVAPQVEAIPTSSLDDNTLRHTTEEEEREAMKTVVQAQANCCAECKTRIPEQPSELRGMITDLEHMYQETWKELRVERHRSSRYRRESHEMKVKRLEDLKQHEVSEALKELEGRYQEVRDELKIERNKSFTYKKMAFTEKATYSGLLARVAELEEMNAKLQGKYEAAMAIVGRLQGEPRETAP